MATVVERELDSRTRFAARRQASAEAAWVARQANGRVEADALTSSGDRHRRICEKAYFKAMDRGFAPGMELCDWLEAEREVDDA